MDISDKYKLTSICLFDEQNKLVEPIPLNKETMDSHFKIRVSTPEKSKFQLVKILMDDSDMIKPLNVDGSIQEIQFNADKDSDNPSDFLSKPFIDSAIKEGVARSEDSTTNPNRIKVSVKCCDVLKSMMNLDIDFTKKDFKFFTDVTYVAPSLTFKFMPGSAPASSLSIITQAYNEVEVHDSKGNVLVEPTLVDNDLGDFTEYRDFRAIDKKLTIYIRDDWGVESFTDVSTYWNKDEFNRVIAPQIIELYKQRSATGHPDYPPISGEYHVAPLDLYNNENYRLYAFKTKITTDNYEDITITKPEQLDLIYDSSTNQIKVYNRGITYKKYEWGTISTAQIKIGKHKSTMGCYTPLVYAGYNYKSSLRSPSRIIDFCPTEETSYEFNLSKEDVDYFSIYGIIINDKLQRLICFKDINKK